MTGGAGGLARGGGTGGARGKGNIGRREGGAVVVSEGPAREELGGGVALVDGAFAKPHGSGLRTVDFDDRRSSFMGMTNESRTACLSLRLAARSDFFMLFRLSS